MKIEQGDIFWIAPEDASTSASTQRRPYVVVQNSVYNHSRMKTVVVCALTYPRGIIAPGNVLLDEGEAGLPRRSVVNVTMLFTIYKDQLGEKIGVLSAERIGQIWEGIRLVIEPREPPE